jgi:hypothetical protein
VERTAQHFKRHKDWLRHQDAVTELPG